MTTLEIPVRPHTTTGVTPTLGRKAFVEQVMGMPVSVHIRATEPTRVDIAAAAAAVFAHLRKVDEVLSTCFILSMDTKCLCRPDCAGLCDRCGANLNLGPCRCQKPRDPRMAVLEQLLDNKTDEEEEAAHNSD